MIIQIGFFALLKMTDFVLHTKQRLKDHFNLKTGLCKCKHVNRDTRERVVRPTLSILVVIGIISY